VAGDDLGGTPDQRLAYDWMIESVDGVIGDLLNGLGDKRQRTTVFIVADNGTPEGVLLPPYEPEHSKGSIFEQGVRIPFLAAGPKVGTGIHEGVVSVVDLWRTVAAITGATPGTGGDDSVSLARALRDPQTVLPRPAVLVQRFRDNGVYTQASLPDFNARAMVSEEFKYIRYTSVNGLFEEHVFRLTQDPDLTPADPTECTDLAPLFGSLSPTDQMRITALSDAMTLLSGLN
jgi:arylsulfatase A-like enzyme